MNDHRPEVLELLEELDRLAEEQQLVDARDPNALAECERKLDDLRRRIERLLDPKRGGLLYRGRAVPT